jgi:Trk K+ transport system NAD-binding subunit
MNIIIVGGGKVGFALAAQLDKEGHDVSFWHRSSQEYCRKS